jgi:lycopene cyclase domain-containing protein
MDKFTYLFLDLFTLSPILFLSFDKWVKFYKKWGIALISIFPVAVFFVIWDVWFTKVGVWEFNSQFLVGIFFGNLPLEEYLFFLVVPWVCLFIYESIFAHFNAFIAKLNLKPVLYTLIAFSLLGFFSGNGLYTRVNLGLGVLTMILHLVFWNKQQINFFLSTYILSLIPMFFVNGVLTSYPVLIYNPAENLGIRITTIPIEDFIYSYVLIGLVFLIYFRIDKRKLSS